MVVRLVVLAALAVASRPSHAEGWRHAAPEGYAVTTSATFSQYLKTTGSQYCLLGLYNPRPRTTDDAGELAEEWRGVVLKTFAPGTDTTLPARTTRNQLRYLTRTAALVDARGGRSYGELYVVTTRGAVGSLLAVSGTAEALEACRPAIAGVLDSLEEPVVNQPSLVRSWGLGSRGAEVGGARLLYTLSPDGSYQFRSERRAAADRWLLVDEAGTWTIEPGRLTIKPTTSTAVERSRKAITATRKLPLEPVTYAYEQHYLERTHEWNLVLTPPKATARDGGFAADRRSYLFSDRAQLEWQRF